MEINILILSAGTRNKVVQAFRKEIANNGNVIATDCSNIGPAIYDADKAAIVPRIDDPKYIDRILDICKKEKINGVFSLIDPELSLLAKNADRFTAIGTTPIVPSYELCETSLDKYKMYEMLIKLGIPTAKCYLSIEDFLNAREEGDIDFPVFVKPRRGSASININKVESMEMLTALFHDYDDLMIQEYMRGQEYGADVYIDLISEKCTSIFLKKKIKMRAGETDKSVSVINENIFKQIIYFVETIGYTGIVDIDLFHDEENDIWYLSEVNPRFGGGYPHAYECGVNVPRQIIRNLKGDENPIRIGDYREGVYMMKYNEICVMPEERLLR
ncbi:ATP-grasp domain-containing protein [Butyrivibrio sp. DSM 10294]|uniref:ATP-grasp domain-containing protein n=1 Tax=Butyrivibrio sp. DSM 10294 TaxID=2972457 RepID=UPI00234F4416|nr:ATP-grasp domain-containing protein [Butyrivibrio sp. DSM 10294]MDC7292966.1 ATP-grasp domain-containing protein [Butyrivibrio sp. DSM 10294]